MQYTTAHPDNCRYCNSPLRTQANFCEQCGLPTTRQRPPADVLARPQPGAAREAGGAQRAMSDWLA
ncbi:hypothetical protein [Ramlibacter tataouinensis]|uniref:hypothetical protein n=1 Tax=Ramlibacter tataouinensis TaxID=94132 RepID=UPI0011AE3C0C|nr:hypothetical protein [Ramlibacter tataouinensis]